VHRILAFLMFGLLCTSPLAQKARTVDLLSLTVGKPFPVSPLFEAKDDNDMVPYRTFAAPMPADSKLNMFSDFDVAVMKDNGNVHDISARRAFGSTESCTQALKVVASAVSAAYHLVPTRSDVSLYEASGSDTEIQASCSYAAGSPYPLLRLRIASKAESTRANEQLKERIAKRFPPK
jgi:hypothetical protein